MQRVEHEYWKERLHQALKELGYNVTKEYPLKNGGFVDLMVNSNRGRAAIEIETGRSNVIANLKKLKLHDLNDLIFLVTRPSALRQIAEKIQLESKSFDQRIKILPAFRFLALLRRMKS